MSRSLQYAVRLWPVVVCALTALIAYLQARGIAELTAAEIAPANVAGPRYKELPPLSREPPSAEPILRRNAFDSTTGPLLDGLPAMSLDTPLPAPPDHDPIAAPKCTFGHVNLIVADSGTTSFASISRQAEQGKSRLLRAGHQVDGHLLRAIGWDRVWFAKEGESCQMLLGDKVRLKPKSKPKRKKPRRRSRGRRSTRLPASIASKIEQLSPTEFNIQRSALDDILEQQAELMRRTRARPQRQDGQVVGLRMLGVRSGTLLETLGIRNGDVVHSINGLDLTNPEKALEAYGRLRTASDLTVQLSRSGKPMTIDYHLQ